MIVLYTLLVFLLGAAKLLIQRKAAALEKKYTQLAQQTEKMLREPVFKEGNTTRLLDPYQSAKRNYLLGCMVEKKERLEAKHFAWQAFNERFAKFVERVRGWKSTVLPYAVGATDALVRLGLIQVFHLNDIVGLSQVTQWLTERFSS